MAMVRHAKNETKLLGASPLFPRLCVKDAEREGLKASPRTKMALYEQLSAAPSQRFTSDTPSMLPLSQRNAGQPSTSINHGHVDGRSLFKPFCSSSAPAHAAEKVISYSLKGYKLDSAMTNLKRKSLNVTNCHTSSARSHFISSSSCSFQPYSIPNFEKSHLTKLRDENEPRVPKSSTSGEDVDARNSKHSIDREKLPCSSSPMQVQTALKQCKDIINTDVKSRQGVASQIGEDITVSQICEGSSTLTLAKNENVGGTTLCQSARYYNSEPVKRPRSSLDQENMISSVNDLKKLQTAPPQHNSVQQADDCTRGDDTERGGEHCLGLQHEDQTSLGVIIDSKGHRGIKCEYVQGTEVEGTSDVSDNSILDSVSGTMVSPGDVVEVIGENKFSMARKVILTQQRIFAAQVFELHRLIKVQKLISASPLLLFESSLLKDKLLLKACSIKKQSSENVLEPPPMIETPKDKLQTAGTGIAPNKVVSKLHRLTDNASKEHAKTQSNHVQVTSLSGDTILASRNSHQSLGNQWLVPVISPSEGLVYKPYTGPCPPPAIYGSYRPLSVSSGSEDSSSTAFATTAHGQGAGLLPSIPLGRTRFPHCGLQMINGSTCSLGAEKMQDQSAVPGPDLNIPFKSLSNKASQESRETSSNVYRLQTRNGNEVQGSASNTSPSTTTQREVLPLFPTTPTLDVIDSAAQAQPSSSCNKSQVIKVVPHSAKLAPESAARIYQAIQERRGHQH